MGTSLRNQLAKIGLDGTTQPAPRIGGGFFTFPHTVAEGLRAMEPIDVTKWSKVDEGHHTNHDWTEECQGIAAGAGYWFLSSNKKEKQAIYQFKSISDGPVAILFLSDYNLFPGHLGAIHFANGKIYAAVEDQSGNYILSANVGNPGLSLAGFARLSGAPHHTHNPWCAINPWDGLIYSSNAGDGTSAGDPSDPDYLVDQLFGYDMSNSSEFIFKNSIQLQQIRYCVQGGAFTPAGYVVLSHSGSSDAPGSFFGLSCYSPLNGFYYGSITIEAGASQEVEGLSYADWTESNGITSQLHVILLENDILSPDDFYSKHYAAPEL